MQTYLRWLSGGLLTMLCGCQWNVPAPLALDWVEQVRSLPGPVRRSDVGSDGTAAGTLGSYSLAYFQLTGKSLSNAEQRINRQILDDCKLLVLGTYQEGIAPHRDSVLTTIAGQSVADVGDDFLARVRRHDGDVPRFYDSLRVDTTYSSGKLLSVRFYNRRNDGGAKDVTTVLHRLFDRNTGNVLTMSDLITDRLAFIRLVNRHFRASGVTDLAAEPITYTWNDRSLPGLSRGGLVVVYPYLVRGDGDNYDTEVLIPWEPLRGQLRLTSID